MFNPLISVTWLYDNLDNENLVILDASIDFQIPAETAKDKDNLIPGSLRFDYDTVFCDKSNSLPHMMPSELEFNHLARQLGIDNDTTIVVYDNSGTFASPRAYWMFRAMGHESVYVLDGGLTEWKRLGYPVSQAYRLARRHGDFTGCLQSSRFVNADFVESQINNPTCRIIDARGMARFLGQTVEPRPGVRNGHIPNSVNLPFTELMNDHRLKPLEDLQHIMSAKLTGYDDRYVFSCGSGVTACILALAAQLQGYKHLSVYDGSWTEWGQDPHRPIEEN
ncbi:sulfurtransferase [Vibrio sp. FNV 38]|nr:sulfurtransferase [Vibrio sp. FNV 38]